MTTVTNVRRRYPHAHPEPEDGARPRGSRDDRRGAPRRTKLKDVRAQYDGIACGPVREALAAAGFDSKGGPLKAKPIKATGAALAKRLIAEREAGEPWYLLAIRTGKPEPELREIVSGAGGSTGRVYVRGERPKTNSKPKAEPRAVPGTEGPAPETGVASGKAAS